VTFLSLILTQLLHALACRHDRFEALGGRSLFANGKLNAALMLSASLQAVAVASPTFRRLLRIARPHLSDVLVAGGTALTAFAINEAMLALRSQGSGSQTDTTGSEE
jgi:Ca2+-transporting ATPase